MMLESGSKLGSYEISDLLGKGGMGEVYRARDTKLGREVAIKVLPSEFSQDEERLARFEREARMLAALNHPNIAAIYGLEQSDDTRFLVLELVEGDTLADQIRRGQLEVERALRLSLQVAEALEAAHEKGVIHRDLKPANIKVTPDGQAKVLDFGLAKAYSGEQADVNLSNSPTLSMQATQAGIILGTAAYMAPEQASGGVSDKRADIWSFGVVLFELLAGRPVFGGETVSHVLAAVLAKDPPWTSLPPDLHPKVRELLERCLEKDPKNRCHDVADIRIDIKRMLNNPDGLSAPPIAKAEEVTRKSKLPWVAAVVLAAGVAGLVGWLSKPDAPRQVSRMVIPLAETDQFPTTTCPGPRVAISPDGTRLAYTANEQLYVRELDDYQPRVLAETAGARSPFFSPDGEWIGFFAGGVLKKVTTSGGTPQTLADGGCYGSWAEDDTILFSSGLSQPFARVSAEGGSPELLTFAGTASQMLPGGRAVLSSHPTDGEIAVQGLDGSDRKVLVAGTHARYVPTGHLIYATSTTPTLMAVAFDLDTLELVGNPVPMVEGVEISGNSLTYHFSVSDSGTLAYLPAGGASGAAPEGVLALVDETGDAERLDVESGQYRGPRVSPDGSQLAVEIIGDNDRSAIWIYDMVGNQAFRRLLGAGDNMRPIWTRDGDQITFASNREGSWGVYSQPADGSGAAELLVMAEEGIEYWPDSWSGDMRTLAFTRIVGDLESIQNQTVWIVSVDADGMAGEPQELVPVNAGGAAFSPGGEWIAYRSGDVAVGPANQVHVQPFPPTGAFYAVTEDGGSYPMWSRDGRQLFYRRPAAIGGTASVLARVDVTTNTGFAWGDETILPVQNFLSYFGFRDYDNIPDGNRIVINVPADAVESLSGGPPRPEINVVLNWFTELRERVPFP